MNDSGRNISLVGKSGHEYMGTIYHDKSASTDLQGQVIVCLANTIWTDNHWIYNIRDIYTDDASTAIQHFKERDDISHLIFICKEETLGKSVDVINDLRKQYIHQRR